MITKTSELIRAAWELHAKNEDDIKAGKHTFLCFCVNRIESENKEKAFYAIEKALKGYAVYSKYYSDLNNFEICSYDIVRSPEHLAAKALWIDGIIAQLESEWD